MKPAPAPPTTHEAGAEGCPRCGVIGTPTLMAGSGPHACKAVCSHCGRFFRWISLLAPSERVAHRLQGRLKAMQQYPPPAAQLMYLQALGDTREAPGTMAEASERIEALKHQRPERGISGHRV